MFINLIDDIQNQGEQCHPDQNAVVGLPENSQAGIFVEIIVQLVCFAAGIPGQWMHDYGIGLTVLCIDRLV